MKIDLLFINVEYEDDIIVLKCVIGIFIVYIEKEYGSFFVKYWVNIGYLGE